MTSKRSREAAYADVVAGLMDARTDPATDRFDAELTAAEQDGRIDPQTAKVLRWWQRESLRALVEHTRVVLPATLLALEQAKAGADREAAASARSWARASGGQQPSSGWPAGEADDQEQDQDGPPEQVRLQGVAASRATGTEDLTPPTDLTEHRRRLLVAGLTRVSDR
jgi:hypothetical protein